MKTIRKLNDIRGSVGTGWIVFLIILLSAIAIIFSTLVPMAKVFFSEMDIHYTGAEIAIDPENTRYRQTYTEHEEAGNLRMEEGTGKVHIYPYPVINMDENTGLIYIGDSRMVGMDRACRMSSRERTFVIAEEGEGYYYLTARALPEADRIMSANSSIDEWIFVLALGVNDMTNADLYCNTYAEIASEYPTYVLSVNPVSGDGYVTNKAIERFNELLKGIPGSYYIDCYSIMMDEGFNAPDGLHYSYDTYQNINTIINEALGIS